MMEIDQVMEHYYHVPVKEKTKLSGGYSFNTWLVTLIDGRRLIFRSANSYMNPGNRFIDIADIFRREKFFYDSLNRIAHLSPEVYIIDDSLALYPEIFQISEYLEGVSLDKCFDDFDDDERHAVCYKIGEAAATINNMQIDASHPYIAKRGSWPVYAANRLKERLTPLMADELITPSQIELLTSRMEQLPVETSALSFLHLDLRLCNMIYHNKEVYVIDAENSEFGDPYFELARIDNGGLLNDHIVKGYDNASEIVKTVDLSYSLYPYYKMESAALVLGVFLYEVKSNASIIRPYLERFQELKKALLT